MASTISFSGLSASGLDTSSWVDALVSVKQQTITSLEQQKAEKENLLSIVNNIKSYFSSFQTCLQKITDSQYGIASMDLFMQNLALSSNSSIATATATTEAARQSYDVAVDSLATATKATSGYSQFEVKTADLNTTFGTLGGKNGTITVNSQSFNVTTEDTLQNLIDKFKNVGVDAKFDESKGTFTIGMDLNKIDEGATNLKNALKLANNNVSGAVSGSVVYANRNTEFYKLGLNGGDINIEGVKHTITKNGNNYTIQKDGGAAVQMNTLGEFLDYLKSSAVGADDATVDAKGHITIKGATLDKVEGGTNLMDVLNLIESQKRTVSESGALSYIEVRVADLNTKLSALGITGDTTLVAGGTNNTISNDKTLGDIKNILKNAGVDMSVDSRGIITIDTHGNEISGTLLDVLNLDPTKGGTTISSSAHQATLKADGNTKLSELGITTDKKYIAYKSDGTALTTEISNVEGKTVNEFVNALKNSGLDAKFDEKTHQITIKDGYIEGSLADALGMTQLSTSFTENASLNTQLEKLGATGDSTLTIDGGAAKTYDKNTTLETVFNDIKNAGGKVTFKDGNVMIEGVTLGGSLPSLLGLDATTQGTSVTSGKLTAVTGSTSSGGNTESTVEHNIELSTKLGDITGTTSNYTLKVGDGASTTYTKDSTLQDIKTQIEGAGGKFTINDDNTISIEGVTMSGTVVGALGFDELATGTKFTTVNAVMISGTSNIATGDTTLGNLGLISGSTSGARAVRRAPANPNKTLSINGGTAKTYGADSSLDDIFADIVAAGGTASINSEGYIVINGVHLEGTLVDALGLVETSYKTTITSGDLKVTTSTKSTSSSTLYTDTKGDIAWDSTIGSIVGDTNSYDLKVNGTNKTYNTNTKLSDIKNVIQAAGGTMTINDDNTISINGVEISGSLVDKLGFNSDGVHTVVSSNNPIYYTDGKKSADTGTTFEQLGIGADKRDYAIYKNDGTVVKASSTNGTSSGKTIGDWLRVVNDSLNTANGTRDITYASIDNGVISITGGYVTGSLPTELGIGIKETVTGITMEGSSVSYVEYEPLKYIGNIQTGSGIAGGTMVSSGFMAESIKYQDELGNIHAVTETTKLSEVLDTSGNKIGSGSYTFNVGSYTKTFDADSTTLGDIVNYVNNLNMDTTHDTTTSATLVDGKLTIESNVSITGTLLDKLGFEKQDISTVAYEIKGTNKAHYSKSEGVTVTASGFSTAVTTQSTSGADKVYVSSLSDFVSGSTYYVKSASDLNKLAELTNAGKNTSGVKFVLENDIDLAGQQFVPIGTHNNTFKGNFYGNGHVIKNLTITDTSVLSDPFIDPYSGDKIYFAGLFGTIHGAKLYDIGLENVNINLSIDADDAVWAGALVGEDTWYSEINNCYSTGSVSTDGYAGGLVGTTSSTSVLNSYSNVNVNGNIVGGLVASLGGKISNSFATGNANGTTAGGLVGIVNSATISNSFATGNVVSDEKAGGLVGNAFSGNITISDSFAMGDVTCAKSQGGIVGTGSATTVTNCGYSGSTDLGSGVTSGATAMTDAQLKSSIEGLGISSATVVNKTVDTTATTSTTIKDLIGKGGSQTLTLTPTAGGEAVTLTFNDTDTIQTVIDKLKAQGIDEADLTDGIFRIKDDKQWTLNGSSELVNKLFGGDDRTYSAEGPQVTYQVTHSSVGGYTGNKITYTTTTTGTVGSVTGSQLSYTTTGAGTAGSVTGNKVTYETTGTGTVGSVTGSQLTYTTTGTGTAGSVTGDKLTYTTTTGSTGSVTGNQLTYTKTTTTNGLYSNRNFVANTQIYGDSSIYQSERLYWSFDANTTIQEFLEGSGDLSFEELQADNDLLNVNGVAVEGLSADMTLGQLCQKMGWIYNNGVVTIAADTQISYEGSLFDDIFGTYNIDLDPSNTPTKTYVSSVTGPLVEGQTYYIKSATDLMKISGQATEGITFVLDADIDMEGNCGGFSTFKGTFYGNGHKISNLGGALFGTISGSAIVKDVGVENSYLANGSAFADVIEGNAKVENCYVKNATIELTSSGHYDYIGGFANEIKGNATVSNSFADVNIVLENYAVVGFGLGGFVGKASEFAQIDHSYSAGSIYMNANASAGCTGGFAGCLLNQVSISDSYSTLDMSNAKNNASWGSFIGDTGYQSGSAYEEFIGSIKNVYATYEGKFIAGVCGGTFENVIYNKAAEGEHIYGTTTDAFLLSSTALTTSQMQDATTMQGHGFTVENGWYFVGGGESSFIETSASSVQMTVPATGTTKMSELGITDFTVNGSALSGITGDSTVDDVLSKLKSTYGLSEATISDGKITFKSTTDTTLSGNLIKSLMGQDSVSITPTAGDTTSKTYSGSVLKTVSKGYSTDTKLVDIDSSYKGTKMYVYKQKSSTSGTGTTPVRPGTSGTPGKPGSSVDMNEDNLKPLYEQVATLSIDSNTTIQDVIDFYNPYLDDKIDNVFKPLNKYSLEDGTITLAFKSGYRNKYFGGSDEDTLSFGTTTPTVATTSTKLYELETSPEIIASLNVTNNGNKYSFDAGSDGTDSPTIQDVLDFLNNTAGCTATFTDGKLTVTGASDLEFEKPTTTGKIYDMSLLFGGSMPTPTTSTTGSTGGGSTTTHTATGTTKMSELGITDFTVNGSALSEITSSSTVNDVLSKLKSTYGLSEATISDGKITLSSTTDTTLSGNLIKGLMGQDSVSITPTSGTTTTTKTYTGTKVTYGATPATGYTTDTKLSTIRSSWVGKRIYVKSSDYTGSTTGYPGNSMLFQYMDITKTTTIDDVIKFFNRSAGVRKATYNQTSGELELQLNEDYSVSAPFISSVVNDQLIGSDSFSKITYSFGKTGGSSGSPMTASTTLNDLLVMTAAANTITVTNNGTTTSFDISQSTNLLGIISNLQSVGCTASITDGVLTVTGGEDLEFGGNTTVWKSIFGGSIPTPTTSTTGSTGSGSTGDTTTHTAKGTTKMSELGITDFTVNGSALSGITGDSTVDDVLSKLKSTYGLSEATISDGKITLSSTTDTTLSGNLIKSLMGQDSVSITPTSGSTTTTKTYTGTKATYGGKAATAYASNTKLADINVRLIGTTINIANKKKLEQDESGSSSSGSGSTSFDKPSDITVPGQVASMKITRSTTIDDVVSFLNSEILYVKNASYDSNSGELTVKLADGNSVYMPFGADSSNSDWGGTANFQVPKSPAVEGTTVTDVTTLKELGLRISITNNKITVTNNGKTTSITVDETTCIQDIIDNLEARAGCTASITDGVLTVTGGEDLAFGGNTTVLKKIFGGSIPTPTTSTTGSTGGGSTGTTITVTATGSTTLGQLGFGLTNVSLFVDGNTVYQDKDSTGGSINISMSKTTTIDKILSALQDQFGITGSITDGKVTLTSDTEHTLTGTVIKKLFGQDSITITPTAGGSTTKTATGTTKMSELGITDFTVNGSALSGITGDSTVDDVLSKLKSTYGLSEATISDGKVTFKSNTNTTLSGNLIKGLMGQDSVSITASSVTTPASKTGNKVTYTKSTTTNTGYKYTAADYNSSSVYHGMMKDFRLVSFIDTNTTYNSPQGQMLTGRTITGVDKDGLSFSIVIDDSTTLELFDNQLYGYGFRLTQIDAGMWGISKADKHSSGSIDIGDLAYQGSYNAAEYVAVIGKVVLEESGVPYTSTTKYTADSSTKMSDLGLSPTLKVDGKDITGLSSSSTVGEVLSALKSQYGIDGSISDGKMTLTSSSSHTVSGDVINKFFGSDSISLTPTTSGGGGTTTTHTATGSTKMSELGVTDFTVNGSALSGITSSSTIDDVLAKLKSTYGLSEATISDGKITLKSTTDTTLSGNLINRLTGQDSVTISPDTSTTTQTADTTTKLGASGLGLTSFDLTIEPTGDATSISISGLNGDSTIGDVFKKLAEKGITASMNNGVITLTSNTPCDLTGTIAKKLFGKDSVSLECADEIHDFTMTQVSGTKYQYVSRDLTSYSGAERVSEVSELVAGNKYHISSAEDLVALANFVKNGADTTGSIFMFDNDIDMSGVTGFEGIGTLENAFKGTVYGNGHVVKNMKIDSTNDYQGLFGNINQSTIKDLGVVDANVTGESHTGILVGHAENSQISNAYTSGTVTSNSTFVGGLVGVLTDSTATNVYSTADVKGACYVGGLIGDSNGSIVEKAFATGKVTAPNGDVGGLIGGMENGGTVKNSYATGDVNGIIGGGLVGFINNATITYTFDTVYSTGRVSGSQYVGGFVGMVNGVTNIKNAVYNRSTGVDAIGNGEATGILGKDYEQMIQKSIMQNAGFTEDKGWVYTANTTPTFGNTTVTGGGKTYLDSSITSLSSGSTYYISTLEQLNNLATLVNNGADTSGVSFVLDNDIDVSSFTNTIDCFKGTFYGNGHSLTGLKTALFDEVIGNAIVRDLALENMSGVGHLANTVMDNSTVDNVYSTGSTISSSGLIETLEGNATLKNSYSTVNLTVNAAYAGGLVSAMSDNATIEHCFAKNTIEQKFTSMAMGATAGGLVGIASGGTIKSSYADCNINVIKYSIHNTVAGGLIGGVSGDVTIENCYATGSRTAVETGMFIGMNNGRVTSSGNVACTGSSISGTPSGFSDGVTFVSNAELNSQARMEELGFTKDKGWVYYTGKAPMLQGKDTSSAGTTLQMSDTTTLDSICQNRENKTLSVTINGETHSKTFKGSDTVGDVANWLNGIDGVTANISNNKFNISGTSQDFRVDGELADVLFGNNKTTTKQTITENTDSNGLIVGGGQKKIDDNTTVGQLLGVTSGKYVITYIDDSGNLQSGKFSSDEKLSEVLKFLNDNGFQASIVNGVFTATKDGKIATNISGTIGEKLKGENGTVTNTSSGYKTGQLDASSSTKATATTKLADLGIASGSIFIKDNNNNTLGTIQIDNSMTIDDTAQLLANYGFTLGITDGKVTIEGNGTNRIADGTSNLVSQMKLNNWLETKDKLKTDSTVAQMGFGKGSTLGLVLDKKTYNLTFDANATLQDIIDTLGTYGVTASVDSDGKFTATASGNLVLTNELGAYLTKNSAEGYVKEADGYKSKDPLEFKGDKVKLDYDSKVGDILGTGKDGVLRLTLNKDTVVDLTYKADDTMADIIADLKGYGITATIDDGVLKATSNEKTFRFSGEIGKIISGDTPQYDDISTGYVSKDLSYETTNKTNMNNTLKEMGVSSGQIHVLSNDGKIVSTLDIDNSYTVAQVKSLLQPFGMTLSVDENGKFTVASAEGYKLSDSTSNMVSKMGLNNWTTATEKLTGATTLAQMGFKDGADLNLFLDGIVMNVLSFDANQTVDDIIFGLAAYGIDASVSADGQFTATSKSHTFIMSGGLGSYLTKGTGGYVNSDTAYESYKPLVESKDYVETASKGLDYNKLMTETSTLESLGFAQGGTVRVMLDGKTPYTLQFLATDKVQDVIYALSAYGINAEVKDGRFVAESVNNTFTLTGNLGSYLVQGGAYQNEITGYESNPLTYETTEKLTNDTKLSDLGITRGDINVIKDGKVTDTIHISDNTTIGQLFSAIKPYGMTGEIVTKANGDTSIRISADSDIKLADGTSNVVSGLGLQEVRKGDFEGTKKYWDDDATSGLITEDTLLSTLDRNGFIAQGSLIFNTGEGDDAVQHIINISANETVGSLLKKFNDSGIKATLDDGVIKLTGGLDKLEFTGGTSGLVETIGLDIHNIDKYASSTSALTYEGETHYSASNFANANTKLDIVNATDGNMSIFVDGIKCNIEVKSSDSFADLFKKIKDKVKARTGLDIQAGFKTKDGSISANPTDANNTGIIGLEIEKGHELVVGASNDTTNFATIANLNKTDYNAVTGSRALYRVNVNSLITESGLYRDGDITEGTFKIGDAEFTIDSTTTLASLINQINKNDKAYANAYWDTLAGTLVIESTVTGASLINIEAGTSNFTDIMGFTKTKDGVSALVTDSQTLGQNAVVRINGTTVTSATNVITSDISKIKGLTINLKNVSAGETVTISVEQDKEAIYSAVSDTLDAYNSMMEALGKELADKNSLGGESILKLMRNNLKRLMTSSLTGAYVFKNLASVGISTGEASDKISTNVTSLLIDKDKFMDALNTDSDAVQDLLVGTKANPGIFLQANNIVESSINTEGYFSNMANTLSKSISNIEKKISKNNLAIENYRTKLETKFHNMELTISGLQSAYANILK